MSAPAEIGGEARFRLFKPFAVRCPVKNRDFTPLAPSPLHVRSSGPTTSTSPVSGGLRVIVRWSRWRFNASRPPSLADRPDHRQESLGDLPEAIAVEPTRGRGNP